MKLVLEVCLVTLTFAGFVTPSIAAQSPALQKGVNVELAATHNASPMPDADQEDAFVVAITADGSVYLGTDRIDSAALAEKVRSTPFIRGHKLYIKADARTPYAEVLPVLAATRTGGMVPQVLLTGQPESSQPGVMASPKGFDLMAGEAKPSGSVATVVQLLNAQEGPGLTINGDEIPWSALESTLTRHFQKGDDKIILLKADGQLPFAQVVRAMDSCRSTGAAVILFTPEL